MTERDNKILRHIGLYHVSLRAVIEHLFFDGNSCDDVLRRLIAEGRIQASKSAGGFSYYRLTLPEARARKSGEHHSRDKFSSSAARKHLAVLWFCCMSNPRRFIIDRKALSNILGRGKGLGLPHCWEPGKNDRKIIHRIYTPGPNSGDEDLVRTLLRDANEGIAHEKAADFILSGLFIFHVLVETPQRAASLRQLINRRAPDLPLPVKISIVPGVDTLALAIRQFKSEHAPKENHHADAATRST